MAFNYPLQNPHVRLPHWEGLHQSTFSPRLCDVLKYGYDLGLQRYPIWDESKREDINQMIIDHFFMREIGAETIEIFIFTLNRLMRETAPKWNAAFKIAVMDDLANAVDMTTTAHANSQGDGVNNSSSTSHGSGSSESVSGANAYSSSMPQIEISHPDGDVYVNNGQSSKTTADSSQTSDDEGSTDSSYRQNGSSNSESRTTGRNQSGFDLLTQISEAFVSAESMLFDSIEPAFMQVYQDRSNNL